MHRQKAQLKHQLKIEDLKVLEYIKEKMVCDFLWLCMHVSVRYSFLHSVSKKSFRWRWSNKRQKRRER